MTKTYSNVVKHMQLIEQYSCCRFLKFLLDIIMYHFSVRPMCIKLFLKSYGSPTNRRMYNYNYNSHLVYTNIQDKIIQHITESIEHILLR